MRILVIAGYAWSLVNFRGPLLRSMLAAGHEVFAIAPEEDGAAQIVREWGISYESIPFQRSGLNPFFDLIAWLRFRSCLVRWRPDLVFSYTHKPVLYSALAARCIGRSPKVYAMITGLGFAFIEEGGARRRVAGVCLKLLYRAAAKVFCGVIFQNEDDRQLFQRMELIRPETPQLVVRGSGVDLAAFEFAPIVSPDGLLRGGLRPQYRFLMIARLLREKGVREYVEAARLLKASGTCAEFHLVGPLDPSPSAISRREVDRWVQEGAVIYHGAQDDVRPYLRDCHAYVLPSYREGTPRTVLEAMSIGRPVITSDITGCRETVFQCNAPSKQGVRIGSNGFLVRSRSASALAAAMEMLVEQPDLGIEMGIQGRRLAQEYYDVRLVTGQILEFIGLKS